MTAEKDEVVKMQVEPYVMRYEPFQGEPFRLQ